MRPCLERLEDEEIQQEFDSILDSIGPTEDIN
jgi:hypothetical protein